MLTHDTPRVLELGEVNAFVLAPNTALFRGAAVGDNGSGFARPLVAGDKFLGFCESYACNLPPSPAVPAAQGGDALVNVLASGRAQLKVAGLKATSVGAPVFALDENSFSLSGFPNSSIGTVHRVLGDGTAIVAFGHCALVLPTSHKLLLAGSHKTQGGGGMEKIPLPGLLTTDLVQVNIAVIGKTPSKVQCATPTLGSLHVTFDVDPGTDHVLHYVIYRAVS
jgi:hypothetical protein